jgi:hypothetical protein
MNRDLFLAILAMDSYNRGYGQGVSGLANSGHIGNATITRQSNIISDSTEVAAGFYAIAYTVTGVDGIADGSTVISYRGTNYDASGDYSKFRDIWNGWIVGAGVAVGQANPALEFYRAVNNGASAFDLTDGRSITLTGHSLGGGLAGFVGSLHGDVTVGFDYMPFLAATYAAWIVEYTRRLEASGRSITTLPTTALLTELNLRYPSYAGFTGASLEGEVNRLLRNGAAAAAIGGILAGATALIPVVGPILSALAGITGGAIAGAQIAETALLGNQVRTVTTYDWTKAYDPGAGAARHSNGTLVIALYAEAKERESSAFANWRARGTSNLLYTALYDSEVAQAVPGTTTRGKSGNEAATLQTAIAYSALDPSIIDDDKQAKPFGDTAIRAMFNDAGDLGQALASGNATFFDTLQGTKTVKQFIADLLVQYAGALALNDIEQADGKKLRVGDIEVDATQGILGFEEGSHALALDLSKFLWEDFFRVLGKDAEGKIGNGTGATPTGGAAFRNAFLAGAVGNAAANIYRVLGVKDVDALAKRFWGASDGHIIDRFHILGNDNDRERIAA